MLTKRIRQLNRYREIVSLIAKYGYGYVIEDIGLHHLLNFRERMSHEFRASKEYGNRIRCLLEELGPTFIKMGQILSIRSDFLPADVIVELEKLQDHVPPVSIEEVRAIIEKELDHPIEDLFATFSETCMAAASIGQVHSAQLKTGETVVVKVQRPGIQKVIYTDLEILKDLTVLLEKRYKLAEEYHLTEVVNELSKSIKKELDYLQEAQNCESIQLQFNNHDSIQVPKVYWEYTTSRILTMGAMTGVKITDPVVLNMPKETKTKLANLLIESFVQQIFIEGFFHADPHPGNLRYDCGTEQLSLIDFGQVGTLTATMRYDLTTLLIGLMKEDTDMIVKAIYRLAAVPPKLNELEFYEDIERIRKKYIHIPLGELNLGFAMQEVLTAAQNHKIIIHSELTMTGKTLITIEGIIREIDPEINLLTLAKPYGEKLLFDRYNPANMGKRILENAETFSGTLGNMHGKIEKIVDQLLIGEIKVGMKQNERKEILKKIDRASNLISYSLAFVAFGILLLGLMASRFLDSKMILNKLPIVEFGLCVAIFMFIRIIVSIFRSGRF